LRTDTVTAAAGQAIAPQTSKLRDDRSNDELSFVGLELDVDWPKVSVWPESISLKKTSPSAGESL
jgi:hypothetical protein